MADDVFTVADMVVEARECVPPRVASLALMTTPEEQANRRSWLWTLNLLWILPVVLGMQFVAMFWMALTWCGVSGCSGGGYGRISDPSLGAVLLGGFLVFLIWAAPITGLPWHPAPRRRTVVGAIVGVVFAVLSMLMATDGFIR